MGTIYQSIEILSKEKGIDPQIVIDAVKDAMLVAAVHAWSRATRSEKLNSQLPPRVAAVLVHRAARSRSGTA